MNLTSSLLLPDPYSFRVSTTPQHPQLRDLLIAPPEAPGTVSVVEFDSIARHDLTGRRAPSYTRLRFAPSTLVHGCGLVAAGGQNAELALRAADPRSTWCHQITEATAGSINNSIFIGPSPLSASVPRLLVSNNDESIKVLEVAGRVPDYKRSRRRRGRERERAYEEEDGGEEVEEEGVHDLGGECKLESVECAEIKLHTAVNHSSVSPDGRRMVAVGDTNEVFLFDVLHNGFYDLAHVFEGSEDASFSTDWSCSSSQFAVASQDGFVHLYDIRNLPRASTSSTPSATSPRKLATLQTTQRGPAGAARKVKFSPRGADSELLAFTEHRSFVHIVDARTFDQLQILTVPSSSLPPHPRPSLPLSSRLSPRLSSPYSTSQPLDSRPFWRRVLIDTGTFGEPPPPVDGEDEECPDIDDPQYQSLSGYAPLPHMSGYHATSAYFPDESTPQDLVGLDWGEEGGLFVAGGRRVWEWRVDGRGRRCLGSWGVR